MTQSSSSPSSTHYDAITPTFDIEKFQRELKAEMSMGDISRSLRERYSSKEGAGRPAWMTRRKRRCLKTLSVTLSASGNAFGPETYSELKDVRVDNRMKFFFFREDYRPPYRGTFSKPSRILNGRRPFGKDHEVFNYDYDSEAEWEEADEGEETPSHKPSHTPSDPPSPSLLSHPINPSLQHVEEVIGESLLTPTFTSTLTPTRITP